MKEKIINYIENNPGFIKNNGFKVKELNEEKCILEYNINSSTKYIVACSDGVWEFMTNEQIKSNNKKT